MMSFTFSTDSFAHDSRISVFLIDAWFLLLVILRGHFPAAQLTMSILLRRNDSTQDDPSSQPGFQQLISHS